MNDIFLYFLILNNLLLIDQTKQNKFSLQQNYLFLALIRCFIQISLIAIDVGNKYTVASVPRNRGVEILSSDSGSKQIPTVISYQNDKRIYTDQAESQKITNRNQTFYYLPLILGEKIDSDAVKRAQQIGAKFGMKAGANDQLIGSVYFGDEQVTITTQNMMTALMHKILKYAQQDGQQPSDVVLTVPPNWSADKKRQLRACAESCGLNVLGELPQHITVATNYYMRRVAEFQKLAADNPGVNVAFLSIGEVSSWFAVVKMNKQGIQTLNIATDMQLGSIDMDKVLVEIIKKQALAKSKQICLDDLMTAKTQIKLLKAANNAKKILTINQKAPATLECIGDYQVDIQTLISLEEFDDELQKSGIIDRVANLIREGLNGIQVKDLECIESVGGASRVRAIQQIVKEIFGENKIGKRLNPDEAVSIGLGWCGALRSKKYHIPYTIEIIDKITVLQQNLCMQIYNKENKQILKQPLVLFNNGETYPKLKKVTQRFSPGQYTIILSDGDVIHEKTTFDVKPKNFEQFKGYEDLAKDVVKFDDENVMIEIKIQCDADGYFKLSSLSRKDQKLIMENKTRQVENKNYEEEQKKYDEQIKQINEKFDADTKEYEEKKKEYEELHKQYNKELAEDKTDEERKKITVPQEPKKPQKQSPPNMPQKTVPEQYQEPKIITVSEQSQFQVYEAIYDTKEQAQQLKEFELKCQKVDEISLQFEKAKNDLDSIIYQTRDGLDYDLKPYITEQEAQKINQQLDEARQYADSIEDKSQLKEIQSKIDYYAKLFKPYYDRKQSFADLEEYEFKSRQQMNNVADKYIKYTDEKDVKEELDKLEKQYNDMKNQFQTLDKHTIVKIDDFKKNFDKLCEECDKSLAAKKERIDKERAEAKVKADAEKKKAEEEQKKQQQKDEKSDSQKPNKQ